MIPNIFRVSRAVTKARASRRVEEFAQRYEQFFPRVFAYVYGRVQNAQVAEDLVADVFERAFVKAESLRNEEAFATWLFTIARNVVTSYGRKRGREAVVDPDVLRTFAGSSLSVEGEIMVRDEMSAVMECLKSFPQREREIIALKFDAELTNAQIARVMGLSEANVRVILFRTLRKLREMMAARSGQ